MVTTSLRCRPVRTKRVRKSRSDTEIVSVCFSVETETVREASVDHVT